MLTVVGALCIAVRSILIIEEEYQLENVTYCRAAISHHANGCFENNTATSEKYSIYALRTS
jgi:hypothetical protein